MECTSWMWTLFCGRTANRKLLPNSKDNGETNWITSGCRDGINFLLGHRIGGNPRHDFWNSTYCIHNYCLEIGLSEIPQSFKLLISPWFFSEKRMILAKC